VAIRTDSGVRAGNSVSLLIAELDIGARSAQLGASLAWWVRRCATCSAGLRCNVEASIQHVRLRDPLRGEGVFVEQPAEPVATAETIEQRRCEAPHTRSRIGGGSRIGGAFASGGCWPGERCFAPLMLRVDANHALEVTAAEDQQPVKALARRRIETQRSACARARGVRTGAWMTRMPSVRKTSVRKFGQRADPQNLVGNRFRSHVRGLAPNPA